MGESEGLSPGVTVERGAQACERSTATIGARWRVLIPLVLLGGAAFAGCVEHGRSRLYSEADVRAEHERILTGLASPECADRRQVIIGGGWFMGGPEGVEALERRLAAAPPVVRRRAALVLENARRSDAYFLEGGEHFDWWVRTQGRVERAIRARRPARLHELMQETLKVAKDLANDFTRRNIAMAQFVDLAIAATRPGPGDVARLGLPAEVLSLLRDPDQDLRGIATFSAALKRRLPPDEERLVTTNLIGLLRHPQYKMRRDALADLSERTVHAYSALCVDPTDDPRDSEPMIRQWEERWEQIEAEARRPAR